jgi:hypothetical protein
MTDQIKEALADLTRTMRQIRESDPPTPSAVRDGDFFAFPTPGRPAPEKPAGSSAKLKV